MIDAGRSQRLNRSHILWEIHRYLAASAAVECRRGFHALAITQNSSIDTK
jgi:hypothetical protein